MKMLQASPVPSSQRKLGPILLSRQMQLKQDQVGSQLSLG